MVLSELGLRILSAYESEKHVYRDSDFINLFNIPEEDIQDELVRLHEESFIVMERVFDFQNEGYFIKRILPKGSKARKNPDEFMHKKTNLSKVKVEILKTIKYLLNLSPEKCAVGYEDIANYLRIDKSRVAAQLDELNNQPESKKLLADVVRHEDPVFTGNFHKYNVGLSLRGRNLIDYPDDFENEDTLLIQNTNVSFGDNNTVNNFQVGQDISATDITQTINPNLAKVSECIKGLKAMVDQFPEDDRKGLNDALVDIDNEVSVAEPDPVRVNGRWAYLAAILSPFSLVSLQAGKWVINRVPEFIDFSEKLSSLCDHLVNLGLI